MSTLRPLVLAALSRIQAGHIEFVESGRRYRVGPPDARLQTRVLVHSSRFWRSMLRGSVGFSEGYADELWDSDDVLTLLRIGARELPRIDRLRRPIAPLMPLVSRVPRNSVEGSPRNIAAHYDIGNELYALFLDESMTYSCPYFERPGLSLREAQEAKFDRVFAKLELRPEDHLLEIGTGWGALAVQAASRYGCRVTTATLSREQEDFVKDRVRAAGLSGQVTVLRRDYRSLGGRYDKLVSLEMVEAVGWQYLDTFFRRCSELLVPEGLMLLQAITRSDLAFRVEKASRTFISSVMVPGCCLPSLEALKSSAARSTDMRLLDVEDITDHYPRALREWHEKFLENTDRLSALGYDRRFRRLWELYLLWCEAGLIERRMGDNQLLFAQPAYRPSPRAKAATQEVAALTR